MKVYPETGLRFKTGITVGDVYCQCLKKFEKMKLTRIISGYIDLTMRNLRVF